MELLGDYLNLLADATITGRQPDPSELDAVGLLGRRAANSGCQQAARCSCTSPRPDNVGRVPIVVRAPDGAAVRTAAAAVLYVVDGAVANLVEGYTDARRQMARWEE